jgi:hypothetical protein
MPPNTPVQNIVDRFMTYIKSVGYLKFRDMRAKKFPYLPYLFGAEFSHSVPCSMNSISFKYNKSMTYILSFCHVFKIINAVVTFIPVFMVYLFSFRNRAYESLRDYSMHLRNFLCRITTKAHLLVSTTSLPSFQNMRNAYTKSVTTSKAFHSSAIRDLIKSLVTRNWTPTLFGGKLWFSHCHASSTGVSLVRLGEDSNPLSVASF